MKLLQLYNQYRSLFGGEETVVRKISDLVTKHGGEARLLIRTSRGLDRSLSGRIQAFASGIYNPFAYREVTRYLRHFRPDVAHVHNLYPLFSPSVLVALRRAAVPVVMTVHNHFHTCPRTDHLRRGEICELCLGGREYNCVLRNCRENLAESIGYAFRSTVARKMRLFTDNVSAAIALNRFARDRLLQAGFDRQRVVVLPNMVDIPDTPVDPAMGAYALFCGRMSPEKGVTTLLEAARKTPHIPIRLLGDGPSMDEYRRSATTNTMFLGALPPDRVAAVYRSARLLVMPSRCFEGCPLVVAEAMSHGIPVIASRIGGLPEIVDDGVTGLLFTPGVAEDLVQKLEMIWSAPGICRAMGAEGRRKAIQEFSESTYWDRLRAVYDGAIRSMMASDLSPRRY